MSEEQQVVLGRKVYFLGPTPTVQKNLIQVLREQEYEIYIIENYRYAKNILRHNPNSICIINVDSQMQRDAWLSFIRSFSSDEELATVKIGILSDLMTKEEVQQYFNTVTLDAGIISPNEDLHTFVAVMKGILDVNHAKGHRQFVRVSCLSDDAAQMYWQQHGAVHQLKIIDISSATIMAMVPASLTGKLAKDQVLQNVTIVLGKHYIVAHLKIFIVKTTATGSQVVVFMFPKNFPPESKTKVSSYIFNTLQEIMMYSVNDEPLDRTNYQNLVEVDRTMDLLQKIRTTPPLDEESTEEKEEIKNAVRKAKNRLEQTKLRIQNTRFRT